MGIEGLKLAVQVDLLINRVFELGDAGADVLVLAGPEHMELVRVAEIVQRDPSAVEGFFGDLLAVELAAVDRGREEVDERTRAGFRAEEVDRGFAGERLAIPAQVERNVVQRGLDQLSSTAGFIARQIVFGVHSAVKVT